MWSRVVVLVLMGSFVRVAQEMITVDDNELELELVQVLFRHGERTPLESESYPRDPYALGPSYGTWIPGRLTDLGRFRMRRLGQALRRRYGGFLRTVSGANDIYAYSADTSSCKDSLQELTDALRIISGPLTIHSHRLDMLMNSQTCSRFEIELKRVRQLPEVLEMLAKYEGLYTYIIEKTSVTFEDFAQDQRLYQLYNLLEAQQSMNLSLPGWCPENLFTLLSEIAYLHFNLESYTQELRRLNGGPLVRRFLDAMSRKRSRNNTKLHLYSGEDRNVAAFTRAIDKHFPRLPNFGNAVIVEKHRGIKSDRSFARIMIWTGVTEKLFPVSLPDCTEICPLENYTRIISESLPTNEDMKCLINDYKTHKYQKNK